MSDGVKFIFKTLFKVPVIIFVSFIILNIFAFFFIYFKVLGLSYVVMQTAVENNYIPPTELGTLCNYAYTFENIPMVTNSAIVVGKDVNSNHYFYTQSTADSSRIFTDGDKAQNAEGAVGMGQKSYEWIDPTSQDNRTALIKKQYGNTVTVGVHCGYRLVWPLGYKETISGVDATGSAQGEGDGVQGLEGTGATTFKTTDQLTSDRKDKETIIQFDICHTVPGLKYYPDLLSNGSTYGY